MRAIAWFVAAAPALSGCLLVDGFDGQYTTVPPTAPAACATRWSHAYGTPASETVGGIAFASGAQPTIYMTGSFSGDLVIGSSHLQAIDTDGFIARHNDDGEEPTAVAISHLGTELPSAIAVGDTHVVIAGSYTDGASVCAGGAPGGGIFVLFADIGLNVSEPTCLATMGEAEVTGIVVQGDTARIVGSFTGTLTTDTGDLTSTESDGFVATVDSTGASDAFALGGEGEQTISAIALWSGGFVIAGIRAETPSSMRRGEEVPTDAFVAVYDAASEVPVVTSWSDNDGESQEADALVVEGGQVFLAGEIDGGELVFGPGISVTGSASTNRGYVAAFPLDGKGILGSAQWVFDLSAEDLDVKALGATNQAVYLGGRLSGPISVGEQGGVGAGADDVFVTRLIRTDGTHDGTMRCGDTDIQELVGIATDVGDDHAFFAAQIRGSIDVNQHLTSQGESDALIGEVITPSQ